MDFRCFSNNCQNIPMFQCSCKESISLICKDHICDHIQIYKTLKHKYHKLEFSTNYESNFDSIENSNQLSGSDTSLKIIPDNQNNTLMRPDIEKRNRRPHETSNLIEETKNELNQKSIQSEIEEIAKSNKEISSLEANINLSENIQITESSKSDLLEERKGSWEVFKFFENLDLYSLDENDLSHQLEDILFNSTNFCCDEEFLKSFGNLTEKQENLLLKIIFLTEINQNLALAASNSMSILVKTNYSFNQKNFKNVKIPYANLSDGIFYKTDFSGSDLSNCIISKTQFLAGIFNNTKIPKIESNSKLQVQEIKDLAISHSGLYVATCEKYKIKIWDINQKEIISTFYDESLDACFQGISWSYDDKFLMTGNYKGTIFIWDPLNKNLIRTMHASSRNISSILWAPNDDRIAWCSFSNIIKIQNYYEDSSIFKKKCNCNPTILAWSPSGRYLAYYCGDQIIIWDLEGKLEIKFNIKSIYSLEWIYGDDYLACAGKDTYIRIRDIVSRRKVLDFCNEERDISDNRVKPISDQGTIGAIKWNEKWKLLAVGNNEGTIKVWSLRKNADNKIEQDPELLICGHSKPITSLSWSDQLLASGSFDGTIKIWQFEIDPNSKASHLASNSLFLVENLLWSSPAPALIMANCRIHEKNQNFH